MNFKTTFLLFGLLIGMLWLFGIAIEVRKGHLEEGYLFPSIQKEKIKVKSITLDRGKKLYKFAKQEDGEWTVQQIKPESSEVWRVRSFDVENMIDTVTKLKENEEADTIKSFAEAKLDSPPSKIILHRENGSPLVLNFGRKSGDEKTGNIYVSSSEKDRVPTAVEIADVKSIFFKDIKDLRSKDLLAVSAANTNSITFTREGKEPKTLAFAKNEIGQWYFKEPNLGAADFSGVTNSKENPGVKSLINEVGSIAVQKNEDFVSRAGQPLEDFGVGEDPANLRITAKWTDPISGKTTEKTLLVGAEIKGKDKYYARLAEDNFVVLIDKKKLQPVFAAIENPRKYRSKDLVQLGTDQPEALVLQSGKDLKNKITLLKVNETQWQMSVAGQTYKADMNAITGKGGVIDFLRGERKVEKFLDDPGKDQENKDKEYGFDNPTAEVAFYLDGVEKITTTKNSDAKNQDLFLTQAPKAKLEEKAEPEIRLIFGKKVQDNIYVKRLSKKSVPSRLLVPAEMLEAVTPPNGSLAFLENELPSWGSKKADKLELAREDVTFLVDKQDGSWKLLKPEGMPRKTTDKNQVSAVLQDLKKLQVLKWAKKFGEKDSLEPFGLAKPSITATVYFKKASPKKTDQKGEKKAPEYETKIILFGKTGIIGLEEGVYAQVKGMNLVFLAPTTTFRSLKNAELRDPTIFDFDPNEVRGLKVEYLQFSRKENISPPLQLQLKRTSEKVRWESTRPNDDLEQILIQSLLNSMARLKTKKFVSFDKDSLEKYKVTPKTATVAITFKLAEGEDHTLRIGEAMPKGKGFYAAADTIEGVVFTLPDLSFLGGRKNLQGLIDERISFFSLLKE